MSDHVPAPVVPEPILITIGDIAVTPTTVITPSGRFPLRGTTWIVQDNTQYAEGIATVGIVLAVVFIWACFLSLLFLLMKEKKATGFVQVTVTGPGFHHATMIPTRGPNTIYEVSHQVNYVRSISA